MTVSFAKQAVHLAIQKAEYFVAGLAIFGVGFAVENFDNLWGSPDISC